MNFLGSPLAFYDLEPDEQKAALTWYLAKSDKAAMFASRSPLCASDVAVIAAEIFSKKAKKNDISGIDIFNM
jgi:hypothetical protein